MLLRLEIRQVLSNISLSGIVAAERMRKECCPSIYIDSTTWYKYLFQAVSTESHRYIYLIVDLKFIIFVEFGIRRSWLVVCGSWACIGREIVLSRIETLG